MPPSAIEPSGTTVDELCGQPEQKLGSRIKSARRSGDRLGRSRRQRRGELRHAALEPAAQDLGDRSRRELAFGRNQRRAALVVLAEQARPIALVVEDARELLFEQRALLLDHQHVLEPGAEAARAFRLERPDHRDLVDREADLGGAALVDAEVVERLAHVEVALAGGDDAEAPLAVRRSQRDVIETVGAHVRLRRRQPLLVHAPLDVERQVRPADRETARRHLEVARRHDLHALRADLDRARAVDRVGEALHRDPRAREAREREAVQAEVEVLLHARRIEDGDRAVDQRRFALVRDRRRARGGIVAAEREHAAARRGARVVGVLQRVAGAVDAGALAVPDAEDAVVVRAGVQRRLLRSPHRRRGEVLVDARLEAHVMRRELLARRPEPHVVGAERRAAIAGDEARRVQPGGGVATALLQRQSHQRLHAGQIDAPGFGACSDRRAVRGDGQDIAPARVRAEL